MDSSLGYTKNNKQDLASENKRLIRDIYMEENQLRKLHADERKSARATTVAPKIDAFFEYVHSLEESEEVFLDRMNKAITYAINQEKCLRRFQSH